MFDIMLCDNDIDRDTEAFTDEALSQLQKMFIGKTGILDHDTKSSNQTARIFATEIVSDNTKTSKTGASYKYLKASAYMVRTESNSDLIKEIDGGIKKEVSISCAAGKHICSVCGADRRKKSCLHTIGKEYGKKFCYVKLTDIKDVYEWSFVAVPAQPKAGVVKRYRDTSAAEENSNCIIKAAPEPKDDAPVIGDIQKQYDIKIKALEKKIEYQQKHISIFKEELQRDVIKLCAVNNSAYSKFVSSVADKLSYEELADVKKELSRELKNVKSQLTDNSSYKVGV